MSTALTVAYAVVFLLITGFVMRAAARRSILWGSVAALVLGLLFFVVIFPGTRVGSVTIPGIAMVATESALPLPVPSFAFWTYIVLIGIGVLLVVTASEEALAAFAGPIERWLVGDDLGDGLVKTLRKPILFGLLPLTVAAVTFFTLMPSRSAPVVGRQAHPSISYDEDLLNPVRHPAASAEVQQEILKAGRHLYARLCSHCHGGKADGTGPMASALGLPPANFTDPGTIATLVEGYAFERIKDGGIGLPASGTPWDSAMPRWNDELSDEQIVQILIAEYDLAGVSPRVPEKLE